MIDVRAEQPGDAPAIRELHRLAFGQDQEGRIVDALRTHGAAIVSLVAVEDERVIGHVLFSPARVGGVTGAALGPMAVLPDHQNRGIGTRLVETGIAELRRHACPFIVLVGHPAFYPRFGFRPANARAITCEWDVPDEAFMVLVLDEAVMAGASGQAAFRAEFSAES